MKNPRIVVVENHGSKLSDNDVVVLRTAMLERREVDIESVVGYIAHYAKDDDQTAILALEYIENRLAKPPSSIPPGHRVLMQMCSGMSGRRVYSVVTSIEDVVNRLRMNNGPGVGALMATINSSISTYMCLRCGNQPWHTVNDAIRPGRRLADRRVFAPAAGPVISQYIAACRHEANLGNDTPQFNMSFDPDMLSEIATLCRSCSRACNSCQVPVPDGDKVPLSLDELTSFCRERMCFACVSSSLTYVPVPKPNRHILRALARGRIG